MTDCIVCPVQTEEAFDPGVCFHCHFFEMNRGKHLSFSCRKQKTRSRKLAFTDIMLCDRTGFPYLVQIEKE